MTLSLGPIRIAKRQWKRPWSMDPFGQDDARDAPDPEKLALTDDMDADSDEYDSQSSRATSHSLEPMLQPNAPSRHMASAYDDRTPRRRFNLYFTLAIASSLIIFILVLTRLSYNSAQQVAVAVPQPKPLPYESFPFLKRYHGGVRSLVPRSQNIPEYPGDEEELIEDLRNATSTSDEMLQKRQVDPAHLIEGERSHNLPPMKPIDSFMEVDPLRQECFLDVDSTIRVPRLHGFEGCPRGFPDNVLGSYDLFGLNNDMCLDRFGRLGPYGLGYSMKWGGSGAGLEGDREGADQVWADTPEVDYSTVRWADAMARCAERNKHRFHTDLQESQLDARLRPRPNRVRNVNSKPEGELSIEQPTESASPEREVVQISEPMVKRNRTCVVIRTWYDYKYNSEDLMYLRSLMAELSLETGSEYVLHFLIHVKNNDLPIWSDPESYQKVLNESLPEEFHGMGTLWSDHQLMAVYNGMNTEPFRNIHLHGAYRSTFMPMQFFASKHPEFDFFWHWELDVRYTGHWYHLFHRIGAWAKEQPRKGLWERNARFYVPSVHGSWEDFRQMVRVQTEHGTSSKANLWGARVDSPAADPNNPSTTTEQPIWGPEPPQFETLDTTQDPMPPTSYAKDSYIWGVGEDADLITFNPLFDPENTDWNLEKDVTGYKIHDGKYPPRRASIITASRLSRRLLLTMHQETSLHKHSMFSEMWPASCALHHGFKAVYAPHPVYIDRRWPTDYMAAVFNAGRNGATGGARTSAFNDAHQDYFKGISWYYNSGFGGNLWKRWLGYKVDNDGGEAEELANEGRMCLPGMLIHPVKQFDWIYEHREDEPTEQDATALESEIEKVEVAVEQPHA